MIKKVGLLDSLKRVLQNEDKMEKGSEWVCTIPCFISEKNKNVAIVSPLGAILEVKGTFRVKNTEFVECEHWTDKRIAIPTGQFLACFVPKDEM